MDLLVPTFLFHSFTKRLQHQAKSSGCSCCFLCAQLYLLWHLSSICDGIRSCVFCLVDIERKHSRHCVAVCIAVSSMHVLLLRLLVLHVFSWYRFLQLVWNLESVSSSSHKCIGLVWCPAPSMSSLDVALEQQSNAAKTKLKERAGKSRLVADSSTGVRDIQNVLRNFLAYKESTDMLWSLQENLRSFLGSPNQTRSTWRNWRTFATTWLALPQTLNWQGKKSGKLCKSFLTLVKSETQPSERTNPSLTTRTSWFESLWDVSIFKVWPA